MLGHCGVKQNIYFSPFLETRLFTDKSRTFFQSSFDKILYKSLIIIDSRHWGHFRGYIVKSLQAILVAYCKQLKQNL